MSRAINFPHATPVFSNTPTWLYFGRPTTMAFNNLTTRLKPPRNLRSLLGLNLKFILNTQRHVPWATFDKEIIPRFDRDPRIKVFMASEESDEPYNPKMYVSSERTPLKVESPSRTHHSSI
jgi:hypothetical protein